MQAFYPRNWAAIWRRNPNTTASHEWRSRWPRHLSQKRAAPRNMGRVQAISAPLGVCSALRPNAPTRHARSPAMFSQLAKIMAAPPALYSQGIIAIGTSTTYPREMTAGSHNLLRERPVPTGSSSDAWWPVDRPFERVPAILCFYLAVLDERLEGVVTQPAKPESPEHLTFGQASPTAKMPRGSHVLKDSRCAPANHEPEQPCGQGYKRDYSHAFGPMLLDDCCRATDPRHAGLWHLD